MKFGYIKINGRVSQIFINKDDDYISAKVKQLKTDFPDLGLSIEWDNFYSNHDLEEIVEFAKSN